MLVVVKGGSPDETVASVKAARSALEYKRCSIFGVVVNRIAPEHADEVKRRVAELGADEPVYVLRRSSCLPDGRRRGPRRRSPLDAQDAAEKCDVRVGAMSVEHFLDELFDGTLVIVPADRPDILVTSIASTLSPAIPTVAGVVLTGEVPLGETAARLLQNAPFPVLKVAQPTYVAATAVHTVRPRIRAENERLVATALGVFEAAVDTAELERRIAIERPASDADHVQYGWSAGHPHASTSCSPRGGRPRPARCGDPAAAVSSSSRFSANRWTCALLRSGSTSARPASSIGRLAAAGGSPGTTSAALSGGHGGAGPGHDGRPNYFPRCSYTGKADGMVSAPRRQARPSGPLSRS